MKFGIWLDFRNPPQWHRPWAEAYQDGLRLAEFAEQLGFDSVWVSEHHFTANGYLPSVFPALAAIAARTSRIRLGSAVLRAGGLAGVDRLLRAAQWTWCWSSDWSACWRSQCRRSRVPVRDGRSRQAHPGHRPRLPAG